MQAQVTRDTICAGFADRFVAQIIDFLILLIPNLIFYFAVGGVFGNLLSFVLGIGYAVYFWTNSGQTPGKKMMKLQVVKADGGALLTGGEAVIRYLCYYISGIPLALGFLWVIWDPRHEGWHDKLAGTKVLKLEQEVTDHI